MAENMTEMTVEQEEELRAADEIREQRQMNNRPVHDGLVAWLAAKPQLFSTNVRGDLRDAPERHPDVQLLKRLMPQSSLALHIRLAWLCWRARQVRFFHPEHGSRLHVGNDVMPWGVALNSANLRDAFHDEAFEARVIYYARRSTPTERQQEIAAEEEAVALTLMRLPTKGQGPATNYVPTVPPTIGDGKAMQQQEISTAKEQERTEEKQLENLRAGEPVNDGVKVRKPRK